MRKVCLALACALLAVASALPAQQPRGLRADAGSKDAAKMMARPASRGMRGERQAIARLQNAVLVASRSLERRAGSGNASYEWIKTQSLAIQKNLQSALQHLDRADGLANPAEKRHIAQLRDADQSALAAAGQLVAESQKPKPDRPAIASRASMVYEKIQMTVKTSSTTDDWSQ